MRFARGPWEDALVTINEVDRDKRSEKRAIVIGWAMVYNFVWTARFVEEWTLGGDTGALGNTITR